MIIKLIDNFFEEKVHHNIWDYCNNVSYKLGEEDREGVPSTGGVFEIFNDNNLFKVFNDKLKERFVELNNLNCFRSYINFFSPNENPYYHIDNDKGYTCLFYPNLEFELDEGGETQFVLNNGITGILPTPNRMVLFDARLNHKATSFRSKHRFTIAFKYQ